MSRIQSTPRSQHLQAPKTERVSRIEVSSNDPTQRVKSLGRGQFKISGVASNRGTKPSALTLKVGGQTVRVPLRAEMAPSSTAKALQKALPKGYSLDFRLTHRHLSSDVIVTLRRTSEVQAAALTFRDQAEFA